MGTFAARMRRREGCLRRLLHVPAVRYPGSLLKRNNCRRPTLPARQNFILSEGSPSCQVRRDIPAPFPPRSAKSSGVYGPLRKAWKKSARGPRPMPRKRLRALATPLLRHCSAGLTASGASATSLGDHSATVGRDAAKLGGVALSRVSDETERASAICACGGGRRRRAHRHGEQEQRLAPPIEISLHRAEFGYRALRGTMYMHAPCTHRTVNHARRLPFPPYDGTSLNNAAWVDLFDPSEAERSAFEQAFGLHVPTKEQWPKLKPPAGSGSTRRPLHDRTADLCRRTMSPGSPAPTGFALAKHVLLTVRFAKSAAFDAVTAELGASDQCSPALRLRAAA